MLVDVGLICVPKIYELLFSFTGICSFLHDFQLQKLSFTRIVNDETMLAQLLVILTLCVALEHVHHSLYYSDDRQTSPAAFDCLYAVRDGCKHG